MAQTKKFFKVSANREQDWFTLITSFWENKSGELNKQSLAKMFNWTAKGNYIQTNKLVWHLQGAHGKYLISTKLLEVFDNSMHCHATSLTFFLKWIWNLLTIFINNFLAIKKAAKPFYDQTPVYAIITSKSRRTLYIWIPKLTYF